MAMPRPGGKALKIAKDTIPGLKAALERDKSPKSGGRKEGNVEERVMKVNNNLGKQVRKLLK